jgi:pilus assembly protein CpaD
MPRFAFAALLLLALAACGSDPSAPSALVQNDYRLKHPLTVEPATAFLQMRDFAVDPDRLRGFAGQFVRKGSGQVAISAGARGADDGQAKDFAQAIARALLDEGLRPGELRLQLVVNDQATPPGTASLRFATAVAEVPACRDWSEADRNAPHANFGCAVQRNLGAMLADPRDLERPRESGGVSSEFAAAAIDKMNRGAATWSVPLPLAAHTAPQQGTP